MKLPKNIHLRALVYFAGGIGIIALICVPICLWEAKAAIAELVIASLGYIAIASYSLARDSQ